MGKRTSTLAPALPGLESGEPLGHRLCLALRAEILAGRLAPGMRLPATRDLARQYGLSRGTVVSAFEQLRAEGYLVGRVGSGTYVNETLPDELLHVGRSERTQPSGSVPRRRLSKYGRRAEVFAGFPPGPVRAFRTDQPALDLFPTALWARLAGRRLRRATVRDLIGCDPLGYAPLRDAVSRYLGASRGVSCTAEQVIIVSGAQEALDLVSRLTLDPGDRVCMENPGYRGASMVFEALGAKICPVGLDAEGMKLLPLQRGAVRLVYVTPARQFPTGISMSLARRLALLEWARSSDALVFEDDYDSEFRYSGHPLPALQGLDRNGVVLFAGSFSKVLFPSLRLGYLVVPADLVDCFAAAKSLTTRHAPVLDQAVLCDFISEGHFGRHIRRMREIYAERLAVLQECVRERLSGLLELSAVEAGLQTTAWLTRGLDGEAVESAAARRGLEVSALRRSTRGRLVRDGLQLGFAAVDAREIRRGVGELAIALEESRR